MIVLVFFFFLLLLYNNIKQTNNLRRCQCPVVLEPQQHLLHRNAMIQSGVSLFSVPLMCTALLVCSKHIANRNAVLCWVLDVCATERSIKAVNRIP